MQVLREELNPFFEKFIQELATFNTRKTYRTNLKKFQLFLDENKINFDSEFVKKLNKNLKSDDLVEGLEDPYELLKAFYLFLRDNNGSRFKINAAVMSSHIYTVLAFFYSKRIQINPKFLKYTLASLREKPTLPDTKDTVSKEFIIKFLDNCNDSRLKLWVLFLASTGWRADEPLRLRWCDIIEPTDDLPQPQVQLKFSKTNMERTRCITQELYDKLQVYKNEKFALKKTTRLLPDGRRKSEKAYNRLTFDKNQLIFSTRGDTFTPSDKKKILRKANSLYRYLVKQFDQVRRKLGLDKNIDESNNRNKFTPNSLRHYVRTYVNVITLNRDFTEWFIGHKISTYERLRHNVKMSTLDDFKKVEKYFTYSDTSRITAEQSERIQALEQQAKRLDEQLAENNDRLRDLNKEIEMMKKQNVYNVFENVIEKLTQERRSLKQYGSISANEQFEYFMNSSKAKWMSNEDLELLKKVVDSNEILPVALSPPDEDGGGINIKPITKFASKKLLSQIKKLEDSSKKMTDEQRKKYEESLEENIKIAESNK